MAPNGSKNSLAQHFILAMRAVSLSVASFFARNALATFRAVEQTISAHCKKNNLSFLPKAVSRNDFLRRIQKNKRLVTSV